jgi:hypothetical protein
MEKVLRNKAKNKNKHTMAKKEIEMMKATKKGLNSVLFIFDSIFLKSNLKNFS